MREGKRDREREGKKERRGEEGKKGRKEETFWVRRRRGGCGFVNRAVDEERERRNRVKKRKWGKLMNTAKYRR